MKNAALGAQETVDYRDTAAAVLARHPEGIDVVIHLAGDAAALLPALRAGRLVSTLIGSADQLPHGTALVVPVFASPATETLERLAGNQSAGATAVNIQRTYRLEEDIILQGATSRDLESRRQPGARKDRR